MRRILFVALTLSIAIVMSHESVAAPVASEGFEAATYRDGDETLLYRLMKPEKTEPGVKYPLVLFLHGAGERGADNTSQLLHGVREFAKPENRRLYPCFVVAPQCPTDRRWVEVDWSAPAHTAPENPSEPLRLALDLVDKLAAELPVDRNRIYVTGLSLGGYGTWDAIARRPDLFAAAIPVCGGGDTAMAAKIKDIPIWAFHGDKDPVVAPREP